jgi:2-phosphoglycerate kinase
MTPGDLRGRLSHVLWMGGSPCSGKSSIASVLAQRYGVQVYNCDERYDAHLGRASAGKQPVMFEAAAKTWDEVWMRPVAVLVARELEFYREEFGMVVDDLLRMSIAGPLLAEGTSLLPECVAPLLARPEQAIWVVPAEDFQREKYARREWVSDILAQCRQPEEAWENWMGRDAAFASAVADDARERGLQVMEVDGSRSVQDNAGMIASQFGLKM